MSDVIILGKLRRMRGISLVELSRRTGMSRQALSRIEKGVQDPSYSTVVKICDALGLVISFGLRE
jgi:transcriptional regulator with XRE-family HTH domain